MTDMSRAIRLLVVGERGVGKSRMLNEVTHTPSTAKATVGGLPYVKTLDREGGRCFIEFLEIGGDPALKPARSVFYSNYTGIIFVFDASNKASFNRLFDWLREIIGESMIQLREEWPQWNEALHGRIMDVPVRGKASVPVLVLPAKLDLLSGAPLHDPEASIGLFKAFARASEGKYPQLTAFLDRLLASAERFGGYAVAPAYPSSPSLATPGFF